MMEQFPSKIAVAMIVICSVDLTTLNVKCKQPPVLLVAGPKFRFSFSHIAWGHGEGICTYYVWMPEKSRILYHFELNASTMFITQYDLKISNDIICSVFSLRPMYAQYAVQRQNEHFEIKKWMKSCWLCSRCRCGWNVKSWFQIKQRTIRAKWVFLVIQKK